MSNHDVEILVRYVDKVCDFCEDENERVFKKGDVIHVKKAPCEWTPREYDNPEWRILRASSVSDLFMNSMMAPEIPEIGMEDLVVLRRRPAFIDFTLLPSDLQIEIENDQEMSRPLTQQELYDAYTYKDPPKLRKDADLSLVNSLVIG